MEKKKLFINQKYFYFITELFVGIALMGIEMSASRLISVYFSSSQIVWTIIIGVIMIAMASGNYWGGRQADKKPSYLRLYAELLFAGAWVVLIPFLGRFVIAGVSVFFALFITKGLVIWSALFSCLILFVPPLLFLGKVTPSLIKYSLGEKVSGKVIGLLEALNTVGSIIGTFLPTFLTIPFIGTSNSFVLFGSMIASLGIVFVVTYYIDKFKNNKEKPGISEENEPKKKQKRKDIKRTILATVCASIWIFGICISTNSSFIFWSEENMINERESMYNYIKVDKVGKTTYFSTNALYGVQSCINDDFSLTGMYYDYVLIAPYLVKENPNVLVLGNGAGTYGTMLKEYLKIPCNVTGIEIDQSIIDISYEYFHMSKDINAICDDGRNFIARESNKYDIILVDAYSSISPPFHMTTTEFFTLVKDHLTDDGLMIMNINMHSDKPGSLSAALCDTAYGVFENLYKFRYAGESGAEAFATKDKNVDLISKVKDVNVSDTKLQHCFNVVKNSIKAHQDSGIRLKDDTADVEIRSIWSLDELIQEELEYYRAIYKEYGLKGLIERLLS